MNSEILPVPLEKKAFVIDRIQSDFIPSLASRDYNSERILRVLHRLGTWYALPGNIEQETLDKKYLSLYAGFYPIPQTYYEMEAALDTLKQSPQLFRPYGYYLKGNYRILGHFAPNSTIAEFVPEASEQFTGAIPIRSRDYQSTNAPFYYPPVFNIDKHMAAICSHFDEANKSVQTEEDIASAAANFYFWGLIMVHPFLGGNHRAFDRFIEYAFTKHNKEIHLPLNETLNIPNNDPFNVSIYKERQNLLAANNLDRQDFQMKGWKDIERWLEYQHKLNEILYRCINSGCANTQETAQSILRWVK